MNRAAGFADFNTVQSTLRSSSDQREQLLGHAMYLAMMDLTRGNRISFDELAKRYASMGQV